MEHNLHEHRLTPTEQVMFDAIMNLRMTVDTLRHQLAMALPTAGINTGYVSDPPMPPPSGSKGNRRLEWVGQDHRFVAEWNESNVTRRKEMLTLLPVNLRTRSRYSKLLSDLREMKVLPTICKQLMESVKTPVILQCSDDEDVNEKLDELLAGFEKKVWYLVVDEKTEKKVLIYLADDYAYFLDPTADDSQLMAWSKYHGHYTPVSQGLSNIDWSLVADSIFALDPTYEARHSIYRLLQGDESDLSDAAAWALEYLPEEHRDRVAIVTTSHGNGYRFERAEAGSGVQYRIHPTDYRRLNISHYSSKLQSYTYGDIYQAIDWIFTQNDRYMIRTESSPENH